MSNELAEIETTKVAYLGTNILRGKYRVSTGTSVSGDAKLDTNWDLEFVFSHPSTLTYEEAKHTFAEMLSSEARVQCMMIINALRDEVVPIVLPQLKEIAEHEERMWEVQNEAHEPHIRERWAYLPLVR
ncbi:MAG TPA: hypothetical protein VJB57_13060 [Dehalococcoidia bacterium]|nr:hypothetical protein [Dehalococcoidia bacterium]